MNRSIKLFSLIIYLFIVSTVALAQQTIGNFYLPFYKTVNNDTIRNINIAYRTMGSINSDSSNVIVLFPYYGGTSEEVLKLVDSSKLLYPSKYFYICIDPIGNGISSSPSNYNSGIRFPAIQIKDMTDIAYKLLTEKLKLRSVFSLIGGSMGGMQVFQFAADYPSFYSKGVVYCSTPAVTASDIVANRVMTTVLQHAKADTCLTEGEILLNYLVSTSSQRIDKKVDISKIDELINTQVIKNRASFTVQNKLLHLNAIKKHSIFAYYNKDVIGKRLDNKLMIIINKQDRLIDPAGSIDLLTYVNAKSVIYDSECGHLLASCEIASMRNAISKFLNDN